jgi:hypothetical protein
MSVADGPLSGGEEVPDRRAAVAELGAELRALADLAARTEVPAGVLRESARRLRELAPALRERTRDGAEVASVDDLMGRVRMFNPVASHPGADANGTTVVAFRTGQGLDALLPALRRLTEGAPE